MRGTSWIAVILVIVLGSAVGIAGGSYLAVVSGQFSHTNTSLGDLFHGPFGDKRFVHILMIGEDDTAKRNSNGHGLSDTLVFMAIDTRTKDIRAISIPRDTRVEIPGHGTCKINSAHVYGGPELTKQAVSSLFSGTVPIDYYIKTNTTGLRGMVDLLGGVYIVVDKDMHYTDRHGGLFINLHASPEKQRLSGVQAEGFVRFRHDAFGDSGFTMKDGKKVPTGRIVRQQIFMRALANRVLSLPTKRERLAFLDKCYTKKFIVSDLNSKDWMGLSEYFKDIKPESVAMTVLPGAPGNVGGGSYWIPDAEELLQTASIYLNFQGDPRVVQPTVEVLNGSGVVGAARKVADQLEKAGYEITRTANAPQTDYDQSMIISHKGKSEPVERIAQLINCAHIREEAQTGSKGSADVTVIVGRDTSSQQ